jgi:hypothetical protein
MLFQMIALLTTTVITFAFLARSWFGKPGGSCYLLQNPMNSQGWTTMRMLIIAAMVIGAFVVTMAESSSAQAAVCARGVYRAGCVGPNGAVVIHRHARHGVVCRRYGIVGGVRRCILY